MARNYKFCSLNLILMITMLSTKLDSPMGSCVALFIGSFCLQIDASILHVALAHVSLPIFVGRKCFIWEFVDEVDIWFLPWDCKLKSLVAVTLNFY